MTDHASFTDAQVKSIVERIERLHEDRKAIADDIAEVYGEAKSNGFDVPILKKLVAERRKPEAERSEEEAILEIYREAVSRASRAPARGAA